MKVRFKRAERRSKLARKLGVTYQYLYRLENTGGVPSLQLLCKLSKEVGIIHIQDDDGKQYLFIPLDIENSTIDPIEYIDIQKETEDILNIPRETLVRAFKQKDTESQKTILKECREAYEALGEALWR